MSEPELYRGIFVPTKATLNKYGGTVELWKTMLDLQCPGHLVYPDGISPGGCGACGKTPRTKRLVIDHEHVRGWKKMPTEQRWQYVRGLLCWTCNGFRLARGATVENLRGAAAYLERYEARRAS